MHSGALTSDDFQQEAVRRRESQAAEQQGYRRVNRKEQVQLLSLVLVGRHRA